MCGRYALHANPEVVALLFGLSEVPACAPRYNIAPASQVLIIRKNEAAMVPALVRWGLVPRWAKDPALGVKMHNARGETVAEKPAFREAYRKRRCLIPASGFYEWKDEGGHRQPYYFFPMEAALFAFAGLWERWNDLETCTLITTQANETMLPVDDRMPAILAPEDHAKWLAGGEGLLVPCPVSSMDVRRVGRAVNDARKDYPELIEPDDS
jgi:putative SOS response-associated peptidase YedK